ncbi:hypothetical protein [Streptomyces himastatinicus]|uniref:hypothetical protein n=1 Tax=Streptomyces himastatinicus TaxID=998084 RepID=UPI0012B68D2C|nr:hypothetical protein [Streptomyces himastatinicus]
MDLLLLLLAFSVLVVVRQRLLYPARLDEWRYSFGTEHRDARQALHVARLTKRTVEGEDRQQVSVAERRVADMVRSGKERLSGLEREREELLRPGPGERVDRLGLLRLHRHALLVLEGAREQETLPAGVDEELPLAGLKVKPQFAPENSFIHLTRPDGTKRTVAFPRSVYQESAVQDFANRIHNTAVADGALRSTRQNRAAEIASQIKRVKADIAAKEKTGRREVAELVEAQRTDARRTRATADWEAECDDWQHLTGCRPKWWWRW